ncbi:MAG: sensor histidine kinase [Raineya sp.]|nr:sensor histidine kinase [Raineya sp.]
MIKRIIWGVIISNLCGWTWANNKLLNLREINNKKIITSYFQIFEDKSGKLSLQEVFTSKDVKFQAIKTSNHLHLGVSNSVFWLKCRLYVPEITFLSQKDYILTLTDPSINYVNFYIIDQAGKVISYQKSGSAVKPMERSIFSNQIAFSVKDLKEGDYLLVLKVSSRAFLNIPIELELDEIFQKDSMMIYLLLGGFYTIMLLVIFYNFIAFLITQEKILFYSFASLLFFTFALSTYDGILGFYTPLVRNLQPYISLEGLFLSSGMVFLLFFNKNFLKLPSQTLLNKLLNICVVIFSSIFVFSFLNNILAIYSLIVVAPLCLVPILWSFVWAYRNKAPMSSYLLTANVFLTIGAIISLFPYFSHIISIWWAVYGLHIGYVFYVLTISVGLLVRFHKTSLEVVRKEMQILKEKDKKRIEAEKNAELQRIMQEKTNDLIKQNEELKKLNEELDRFVYSISHELSSPLKSLIGLIQLMKQDKNPDNLLMYLEMQERSIKKLDLYTKELTDLLRNARLDIDKSRISFRELLNEVLNQRKTDVGYDKVKKIISIRQDKPFVSDKNRLAIILNNLISNSIQYRRENVQAHVKIQIEVNKEKAIITISDNGQGIGKEHLSKVFDMFYRATEKSQGAGLGLFIVKETINKLKGSIYMHSEINVGTIFKIEIPNLYQTEEVLEPQNSMN